MDKNHLRNPNKEMKIRIKFQNFVENYLSKITVFPFIVVWLMLPSSPTIENMAIFCYFVGSQDVV